MSGLDNLRCLYNRSIVALPPGLWEAGAVLLLGLVLIDGGLALAHQESTLNHLRWLLLGRAGTDSWEPMRQAYEWLMQPHDGSVYRHVFFEQRVKFQYPVTSLLIFAAADMLGTPLTAAISNGISYLLVGAEALAVAALTLVMAQRCGWAADHGHGRWAGAGLAVLMCFTFYPTIKACTLGQVQVWINAWFVLASLCWLVDRRMLAGTLIGLTCLFKPQFALFLVWATLRRQWGFVTGWCAVVIPGLILSLVTFGVRNHLDYVPVLQYLAHHGEAFYPNQSVNGLLNRLIGNGDSLIWRENAYPPYNVVVYFGTMISSAVLVVLALFRRMRAPEVTIADFLIAGVAFTIASPIAWEHHYGILPAAFVVLAVAVAAMPPSPIRRRRGLTLAIAFTLSAHYLPFTKLLADGWGNILQSYLFFGGLMVLWLLHALRDAVPGGQSRGRRVADPTRASPCLLPAA